MRFVAAARRMLASVLPGFFVFSAVLAAAPAPALSAAPSAPVPASAPAPAASSAAATDKTTAAAAAAAAAHAPVAATDRRFTTSRTLQNETIWLVKILEEAHYARDSVKPGDFAQVIPDYMGELDGQHLFFLASDKTAFAGEFGNSVYYNTAFLGNIDAAYKIFNIYDRRVTDRVTWVFDQLKQDIPLDTSDTYRVDRTKSGWPATAAEADELWRKRLKYELVSELLAKKNTTVADAKETLRKRYERMLKNVAEIDGDNLSELYLNRITALYDPHSTYFSASTYEDFSIQMRLKLYGVGAVLSVEDDLCVVKEVMPGGPADLGHALKPNDKIISVAQTGKEPVELLGMKLRKIVELIRGEKGTDVHLVVQPAGATDPSTRREVTITRDLVKLNSSRAHAGLFQVPDAEGQPQSLGVISLPAFYNSDDGDTDTEKSSASEDVKALIEKLQARNVKGIVLDLRRNGGGYLNEAVNLAGLFIGKGPVVQVRNYNGEIQVDPAQDDKVAYSGPLAVLVDRFSASASEIVTGALQNYGRAIVIGDSSTHGKGTVQQPVEMKRVAPILANSPEKTGAVKFTIQKYYLPSGDSTQLKGVIPDIVLPSVDEYITGIGEAALERPLIWDKIPTSVFSGEPLSPKVLTPLRQASQERQARLEEFSWLRKNVDWFKTRQAQKLISVNLAERQKQKESDDAFRKEMKAEREVIAQTDFPVEIFRFGPPPPPKVKPEKKADDSDDDDAAGDDSDEQSDTYPKADVHLREALRVVSDAVDLGRHKEIWASTRLPLTASRMN